MMTMEKVCYDNGEQSNEIENILLPNPACVKDFSNGKRPCNNEVFSEMNRLRHNHKLIIKIMSK